MLTAVVRGERKALGLLPFGIDFNELLGDILHGFFGPGLGLDPFRAAHAVQAGHFPFGTNVLLQQVDLFRRHIELIITAVFNMQVILVNAAHIQGFHTDIFTDTVGSVYHIISWLDVAEVGELFVLALLADGPALGMAEDVLLRHHHQTGGRQFKTVDEPPDLNIDAVRAQLRPLTNDQ